MKRTTTKPRVVVSAVSISAMGALAVFKDALEALVEEYSESFDIIALVHRKSLFDFPGVSYIEFPKIKSSWLRRLRFEYYDCRSISEELKPYLWFAMHDITPCVHSKLKAVYCQNAACCYRFRIRDAYLNGKFGLFTLLYGFLYRINIKSNDFVVVQQDWFRRVFRARYGISNVVVSHPSIAHPIVQKQQRVPTGKASYRFFYPAYPWAPYKNFELILEAARELERGGFRDFEVWLTMDGSESSYAASIRRKYSELKSARFLGALSRQQVTDLYNEVDCLVFPSKLESWGMPITEFRLTGKPILAADLPYAHESIGRYEQAAFFNPDKNNGQLAAMMRGAASGEAVFHHTADKPIPAPFCRDWKELWTMLLQPAGADTVVNEAHIVSGTVPQ